MLYQPNDYYLFEQPCFDAAAPGPESTPEEKTGPNDTLITTGSKSKVDGKKSQNEGLEKFLESALAPLNIYG